MPERPDLDYVVPILDRELRGASIDAIRLMKPVVLRALIDAPPDALLIGHQFVAVTRHAHFVRFQLEPRDVEMVVSPMLAGRFSIGPARKRGEGDLALGIRLTDGRELRYRDDVQMGKIYLIPPDAAHLVPGMSEIGVDVLDTRQFTHDAFRQLARGRRDQVKIFLMDKRALDAMGNAYADEVLWEAQLHPKTMVRALSADELDRLHDAIVKVLADASRIIAERKPPMDEKLREFLNVRGRAGQPCRRCGATLRRARVHADDAVFCPQCQPDARRSSIVDWRRLS